MFLLLFIVLAASKTHKLMPTKKRIKELLAKKQGMNSNGQCTWDVLDKFRKSSSWFWTYSLEPNPESIEWANKYDKEFVPLISLKRILPKWYERKHGSCSFFDGTCTVDMLVDVLEQTKEKVKVEYLMGYNEPHAAHQEASSYNKKALKSISGTLGAKWWRLYIQPAAQKTGLKLVSPTTGISSQKTDWMIEFLEACYAKKDADPPCDVELIKTYSVHEYKCYGSYWRKYASLDGGQGVDIVDEKCEKDFEPRKETNIYTRLKTHFREKYGDHLADTFWDPYFNDVKLWVTETSCSGDLDWDRLNKGVDNLPETPTAEESCSFITGQDCLHQEGSVAAILEIDNIERFSWFTTYPNPPDGSDPEVKRHPNYNSIMAAAILEYPTENPKPVGRALLGALRAQCFPEDEKVSETLGETAQNVSAAYAGFQIALNLMAIFGILSLVYAFMNLCRNMMKSPIYEVTIPPYTFEDEPEI